MLTAPDPRPDAAKRDRPPDAKAAFPDPEGGKEACPGRRPKYVGQSVITWYSRPPIRPNGIAHQKML